MIHIEKRQDNHRGTDHRGIDPSFFFISSSPSSQSLLAEEEKAEGLINVLGGVLAEPRIEMAIVRGVNRLHVTLIVRVLLIPLLGADHGIVGEALGVNAVKEDDLETLLKLEVVAKFAHGKLAVTPTEGAKRNLSPSGRHRGREEGREGGREGKEGKEGKDTWRRRAWSP